MTVRSEDLGTEIRVTGLSTDIVLGGRTEGQTSNYLNVYSSGNIECKNLAHSGTTLGFYSATAVTQRTTYTQTYTSTTRTLSAYTADAETTYTGISSDAGALAFASITDLNALRVAYENLRAMAEVNYKATNMIVTDLKSLGLVASS